MKINKKFIKYLAIIAILAGVIFIFVFIKNNYREGLTPGKTTPGKTTPGKTTPGKTTPGKTTPGKTTPGKTTPAQTTPAPIIEEPKKYNGVIYNPDGSVSNVD